MDVSKIAKYLNRTLSALSSFVMAEYRQRTQFVVLGLWVIFLSTAAYFLLVQPNGSHTTRWLNDVMGLTDAAYRTYMGKIPSIDFQTVYGIVVYFPASLGFRLGMNASAVLAFGQLVVAGFLLPLAVIASYRRFSLLPSLILLLYLFLLIVAPIKMGGTFLNHTFGEYYNKHCYAALLIVLLHYVEPRNIRRVDFYLDSAVLALLMLFLVYSKVPFAAVALGFVAANALTSKWKLKPMSAAVGMCFLVIGGIWVLTRYNSAYLADIIWEAQVKPEIWSGVNGWIKTLYSHVWEIVAALLAFAAVFPFRRNFFFDLAFVLCAVLASFMLRDYMGGDLVGFPLLVAVFLSCSEVVRRNATQSRVRASWTAWPEYAGSLCVFGLLLAFVSEPIQQNSKALYSNYLAIQNPIAPALPGLAGYVPPPPQSKSRDGRLHDQLGHDQQAHESLEKLRKRELGAGDYWPLIVEGCRLLDLAPLQNRSVVVFEHSNPFIAVMKLKPPAYGFPFLWEGAEFSAKKYPAPALYFSDADYVMVPTVPYNQPHLELMRRIYGSYLRENYSIIQKSPHWNLWARKQEVRQTAD